MDDLGGLAFIGEKFPDFRVTFLRAVEEQNVFRRFGGYPDLTWSLPLGPFDTISDLLREKIDELFDDLLLHEKNGVSFQAGDIVTVPGTNPKMGSVLQIGSCENWTFVIELYGPYKPTKKLLEVVSPGTTAVSVERISAKWLRCLNWAEDGIWQGGAEASGPFSQPVQALMKQAGMDLASSNPGNNLFAPILKSAFGIHLSQRTLEQPLFTGAFVLPDTEK